VLGGNGFIGSHVVDRLIAAGHFVRVFDRSPEQFRAPIDGIDYVLGDFDDRGSLDQALDGVDTIFHLISTTVPSTSNDDPIADVSGNLISSLQLFDLSIKKGVGKIVFLSSGGTVYGIPEHLPVAEDSPTQPICSHGVTKLAIERYLYMYRRLHGLDHTILRVSNPYGERQGHIGVQGVISTFIDRVLRGQEIEIWGDGTIERDYIHVGDVADACLRAGESNCSGVFNIGSGDASSIMQIIQSLSTASGRTIEPVYKLGRDFDVPRNVLDCAKAESELGWTSTVRLDVGIEQTWTWAESRFPSSRAAPRT